MTKEEIRKKLKEILILFPGYAIYVASMIIMIALCFSLLAIFTLILVWILKTIPFEKVEYFLGAYVAVVIVMFVVLPLILRR